MCVWGGKMEQWPQRLFLIETDDKNMCMSGPLVWGYNSLLCCTRCCHGCYIRGGAGGSRAAFLCTCARTSPDPETKAEAFVSKRLWSQDNHKTPRSSSRYRRRTAEFKSFVNPAAPPALQSLVLIVSHTFVSICLAEGAVGVSHTHRGQDQCVLDVIVGVWRQDHRCCCRGISFVFTRWNKVKLLGEVTSALLDATPSFVLFHWNSPLVFPHLCFHWWPWARVQRYV